MNTTRSRRITGIARVAVAFVLTGALSVSASARDIDAAAIRAACEDLVLDYAFYRDRHDASQYAALFTEDAELVLLGETFRGRDVIRARLEAAASGPATRHMMSTIRIMPGSSGTATGVSYVTIYQGPPPASGAVPEEGPTPISTFAAVGEYHDVFELTPDGWRIARREFHPVFVPAGTTPR